MVSGLNPNLILFEISVPDSILNGGPGTIKPLVTTATLIRHFPSSRFRILPVSKSTFYQFVSQHFTRSLLNLLKIIVQLEYQMLEQSITISGLQLLQHQNLVQPCINIFTAKVLKSIQGSFFNEKKIKNKKRFQLNWRNISL